MRIEQPPDRWVMANKDHRAVHIGQHVEQQGQERVTIVVIQGRGGFIHKQEGWFVDQGAYNGDALLLTDT